ncbi:hypothetical protein BX600DRAFT_472889 [Xylariales sp. PMI_506]|nr:hypothetical protein BX600DRAFT_472889 [Xylariales sp. PMI_506]
MSTPPNPGHSDLTEAIIQSYLGPATTGIRGRIRQNAIQRRNTPSAGVFHMVASPGRPIPANVIPIVDRILEPQTIAHFMSFMDSGILPGGGQTALPLLGEDTFLVTEPYSNWAPPSFNRGPQPAIEDIMQAIGSFEDSSRLQCIAKDLHAMKSRLWEGVMPISERRWADKGLSDPQNFSAACQLITSVLNVFQYLNLPPIKAALRDTYNIIWGHLQRFEVAINAKRAAHGQEAVKVTSLWAEYMRAHYALMESRTHSWVTQKIALLKEKIIRDLRAHRPSPSANGQHDALQWTMMDMWQDLTENQAWADFAIFIPMDGYKGCHSASATGRIISENLAYYGTSPIQFSTNIDKRGADYHLRRRQLNLLSQFSESMQRIGTTAQRPANDPDDIADSCLGQSAAQDQTRLELRGNPPSLGRESWIVESETHNWGYIAYRNYHGHSDAEWNDFVTKFEADASNWGRELTEADVVRSRSKIHWIDVRELDIKADLESIKEYGRPLLHGFTKCHLTELSFISRHYKDFRESERFPEKFVQEVFLVADKASIDSYLHPVLETGPAYFPLGDFGGFITAVDPDFDPNEENPHAEESPGYSGTMRILGSLLWDDLGALIVMQTQGLFDLWPLAMNHPFQVYVGPVVKMQQEAWARLLAMTGAVFAALPKWQTDHGQSAHISSGGA